MSEIDRRIESWHRYGSYLTGITNIAAECPWLTLGGLLAAIGRSGNYGGWSCEAIENAFRRGIRGNLS